MSGIFYDPAERRLHAVQTDPEPGWTLVTHNLEASVHHCRRIMREWITTDEMFRIDWSIRRERLSA
ncbi:MAG: hypothetical protein V9G11_07855 [Bifidobacterium adolescentis]|jgi:hypothetical protein